jgi:glutamate dehydrogenase (NADP+)
MAQNSQRIYWSRAEVDQKLCLMMQDIYDTVAKYGRQENGNIDYLKGANIAGFVRVAKAMLDQGVV